MIEEDYDEMLNGVQRILKRKDYAEPERAIRCVHVPDGFVYEETPFWTTVCCLKCGVHYDVDKHGNEIQV